MKRRESNEKDKDQTEGGTASFPLVTKFTIRLVTSARRKRVDVEEREE